MLTGLQPDSIASASSSTLTPYGQSGQPSAGETNSSATNVVDPFGEAYGYQYSGNANRSGTNFFDLWTRANGKDDTNKWYENW